jgi:hypothetical protein
VLKKNEIARYGEYRIARLVSPPGMPRRRAAGRRPIIARCDILIAGVSASRERRWNRNVPWPVAGRAALGMAEPIDNYLVTSHAAFEI